MSGNYSDPEISIIMPAFNAEQYIAESIESVLRQSYKNFELIIVDDGSTDDTAKIVGAYQKMDERVVYISQANAGVSAARNKGLAVAKGKYLAVLDSDDLWPEDKLNIQIKALEENSEVIVLGDVERFGVQPDGTISKGMLTKLEPALEDSEYYFQQVIMMPSTKMVHFNTFCGCINYFKAAGGWDESLKNAEDWDFWLRLAAVVPFVHLNKTLQLYRKHSASTTSNGTLKYETSMQAQLKIINKCQQKIGFGFFKKRTYCGRVYGEVMGNLLYARMYAATIRVYFGALIYSNIYLSRAIFSVPLKILLGLLEWKKSNNE